MANCEEWKNELIYINELLETHGNSDVPKSSIPSYLITQMAQATNDHRFPLATALSCAAICWKAGNYTDAKRVIREAYHNV
jgi:hypothetical protein